MYEDRNSEEYEDEREEQKKGELSNRINDSTTFTNNKSSSIDNDILPISYEPKRFGTLHPDYENQDTKRVRFSTAEKSSLIKLVEDLKRNNNGNIPVNLSASCLKLIWNSPQLVEIFHIRHVLNSGRLRSCLKALSYVG